MKNPAIIDFGPRSSKPLTFCIDFFTKIKYFFGFKFYLTVFYDFCEKSTDPPFGPSSSKPLNILNLFFDFQDIIFFGFRFLTVNG